MVMSYINVVPLLGPHFLLYLLKPTSHLPTSRCATRASLKSDFSAAPRFKTTGKVGSISDIAGNICCGWSRYVPPILIAWSWLTYQNSMSRLLNCLPNKWPFKKCKRFNFLEEEAGQSNELLVAGGYYHLPLDISHLYT